MRSAWGAFGPPDAGGPSTGNDRQSHTMTLRDIFDSITSSSTAGLFPIVLPRSASAERSIDIQIENPFGVPAHYSVAWLRRHGRPVTKFDEIERRVGIPTPRTIQILLDESSIDADHQITIRAAGRTSKLILYRELLADFVEAKTSPEVGVAIAATGAVQFSVRRPGAA